MQLKFQETILEAFSPKRVYIEIAINSGIKNFQSSDKKSFGGKFKIKFSRTKNCACLTEARYSLVIEAWPIARADK